MRQSVLTRAVIFGIAILAALIYLLPTFVEPIACRGGPVFCRRTRSILGSISKAAAIWCSK